VSKQKLPGKKPPRKNSERKKKASRSKAKSIIIKGSGTRFDGSYDPETLLLKIFIFTGVVCLLAIIFL